MKKPFFLFLLFGLALQGCGSCDGCIMPGGVCGQAGGEDETASYEKRKNIWGLKLQIGDYVLDSIFPPLNDRYGNRYYYLTMDSIETKVPNYREVPHIGRVYGWDPECAETIYFNSQWYSGWGVSNDNFYIRVDPLGYFDFSEVLETYPFEVFDKYPFYPYCSEGTNCSEGNKYIVFPSFVTSKARKLKCLDNSGTILLRLKP
jgi:hypothetical protein